jgi:hypothetical protein
MQALSRRRLVFKLVRQDSLVGAERLTVSVPSCSTEGTVAMKVVGPAVEPVVVVVVVVVAVGSEPVQTDKMAG